MKESKKDQPVVQEEEFTSIPKPVLNLISKAATKAAIDIFTTKMQEQRQAIKDARRKSTRILLKKYRSLKAFAGNAVSELTQLLTEEDIVYLESMGMDNIESRKVESIKERIIFTNTVMAHIDTMLELYRNKCLSSNRDDIVRRWCAVEAIYLSEDPITPEDFAEQENINERTVFKDLENAIKELSGLFFGIDLSDLLYL